MTGLVPQRPSTPVTTRGLHRQGLQAAHDLVAGLRAGQPLDVVSSPLALPPGESCRGACPVRVEQWLPPGRLGPGVDPRPQWRTIDAGHLFVTDARFGIAGGTWVDIWYSQIRLSEVDPEALLLHVAGTAPLRLVAAPAPYWFVLFRYLAYGELVQPPPVD